MQKEILNNQSTEKALTKQWETPNPIKVNRVPKAPQVQAIQSSLLRVHNNIYTGFLPSEECEAEKIMSNNDYYE